MVDGVLYVSTSLSQVAALDAQTGKPIPTFGQNGRIDLTEGLGRSVNRHYYGVSSPLMICRDVIVMGSKVHDVPLSPAMPPGDVRGFDVRTGWQLRDSSTSSIASRAGRSGRSRSDPFRSPRCLASGAGFVGKGWVREDRETRRADGPAGGGVVGSGGAVAIVRRLTSV